MSRQSRRRQPERGAVIIHVAIALLALLAFTAFVVDYGIMWVSRRQAQNAADAGALGGAVSLLRDGGSDADAIRSARFFAETNPIWGQANTISNVDVTPSGPSDDIPPCGTSRGCVRVDVFRNMPDRDGMNRGNALPTYFARIFGRVDQGVRATATAETASGNMITCLKPWTIPDKWTEGSGDPWTVFDTFNPADGDFYTPPYQAEHSGYTVEENLGLQLVLKQGDVGIYSSGWTNLVDLPDAPGTPPYRANLEQCNPTRVGIATETETCPSTNWPAGCIDVYTGEHADTKLAVDNIISRDPGAYWGTKPDGTQGILGSNGSGSRIIPLALFDISELRAKVEAGLCKGTNCVAKVVNILGFFLEGTCDDVHNAGRLDYPISFCGPNPGAQGKPVVGRLFDYVALEASGPGLVDESAAFLQIVRLVR